MQANAYSKYALKDLHQSIDLIDRKISHCHNFAKFDSPESRACALRKLSTKRAALMKAALTLTDLGVTYDPALLSRSSIHLVEGERKSLTPSETEKGEMAALRRKRR